MHDIPQKSIEIEGATVEEAIQKALEELELSREEITVKIVCEEQKGMCVMEGARPAKIKVFYSYPYRKNCSTQCRFDNCLH